MASPAASSQTRAMRAGRDSVRLPKRKTRNSGETEKVPQPRKRSKISEEIFTTVTNGDEVTNGYLTKTGGERRVSHQALAVGRVKRQSSNSYKQAKPEGGQILSKTEQYTIKQLPGLPDNIRKDTVPFRAFFQSLSQSLHEVVVATFSNVLIWDYNSTITSPVPTTVRLPETLKSIPLAAVVPKSATAASTDSGLVVVCPNTGKVWYWESTDNATAYQTYSRALKVNEGHIKLMSGELVERMVKVEHGGYVLVLSSGRLAYLSLQDRNSRPAVEVSMLSNDSQNQGSWFGSFRATLRGAWRNTVAAVRTRARNNRFETIALTQEGLLKVWDVEYDGSAAFKHQFDISNELRSALEDNDVIEKDAKTSITVIDFTMISKPSSALARQQDANFALETVVLVSFSEKGVTNFSLIHLNIGSGRLEITRITPITVFKVPTAIKSTSFSLIIPDPGHSAFIVMPNAVIVVSLEKVVSAPRDNVVNNVYQDIVYFQYNLGAEIVASAAEHCNHAEKGGTSGLLLFTKSAGAIRMVAKEPPTEASKQTISPKSKIEQEVFFGKNAQPILDFSQGGSFNFEQKDVERAALELSHEILTSNNSNIPTAESSTENQIHTRVGQLQRLISFVLNKYSPISRATKWRLLWDAEKLEAASQLWKVYERWLSDKEGDEKILFPLWVAAINEKSRGEADPKKGEVDAVRYWFEHDVDRISKILVTMESVILNEHALQKGKWNLLVQFISEAQDVIKTLLHTAYDFRQHKLSMYGLQDEVVEDGVLRDIEAYHELPEPWTAEKNICTHLGGYVAQTNKLLVDLSEEAQDKASGINTALLSNLRKHQHYLVFLTCLTHSERALWLQSRADEDERANGIRLQYAFENTIRPEMLLGLAELGRGFDGMSIAEKLHDMDGLVQLCVAEIEYLSDPDELGKESQQERALKERKKKEMYERLEKYFNTYGEKFAHAFFTAQINNGRLADLLQRDFGKQKELTMFLRSRPEYGKLAWINEVTNEENFLGAGEALLKVAHEREPNIWAKTAEVSLAKLAYMAAQSRSDKSTLDGDDYAVSFWDRLERERILNSAQTALFNHVHPQLKLGIDEKASVDMAMESFGKHAIHDRPANEELLRQGFSDLNQQKVLSPEMLIDVLTLMDSVESPEPAKSIHGREFLWACKVLHASGYCEGRDTAKGEMLRGLIWKRLFVRDDWMKVHATKGKRDKEVIEGLGETLLFQTLRNGALEDIWESAPAYTIPAPADVVGAGAKWESLGWRFPSRDLAEPIAKDSAADDEVLNDYISRCRMASHFEGCKELADRAIEEANLEKERKEQAKREIAEMMVAREQEALGRGRGLVGTMSIDDELYSAEDGLADDEEVLTQEQIDAAGIGVDD
ncbi:uncharacterized protein PV09_03688 [Verruconis gallopava]|uniref:Nucleoporin Nup133/Nup155-like C-terminal domain-containing protein n=1 Tax=Verruconis gallopava TaxID=253628 RepID=A0A0D1YWQ6_9PEZI|nr:uncharacterized protein PV09_03688 [Verruconis gallopava]KIW05137.1 hypothetical protein PV09_03688 [Verruconis gallopava]